MESVVIVVRRADTRSMEAEPEPALKFDVSVGAREPIVAIGARVVYMTGIIDTSTTHESITITIIPTVLGSGEESPSNEDFQY